MYSPGDTVIWHGKEVTIKFIYPNYKNKGNAYMIRIPNYLGGTNVHRLVWENEIGYVQLCFVE